MSKKDTENLTFGQKLSDVISKFGGSWYAIIACSSIIIIWIIINTWVLSKPIDPFPYILLNLFLSCVAALQAPFILMASSRQEAKDRQRAVEDFDINTKAEEEIRELLLHVKALHKHLDTKRHSYPKDDGK